VQRLPQRASNAIEAMMALSDVMPRRWGTRSNSAVELLSKTG